MTKEKSSIKRGKNRAHPGAKRRKFPHADETAKARCAFSKVRRELGKEELSSPAVARLLFDKLERLEHRVTELSKFQERSFETDKEKAVAAEAAKARCAFSKVRRELSEEELSSAAVARLLLDEVERLEHQVTELSEFRDRFHKTDTQKAVLEERIRKSIASDIIFGLALTVGAILIGLTPSLWATKPQGPISLALGVVLLGGGVILRARAK